MLRRLVRQVIRRPRTVLAVIAAITLAFATQISNLTLDFSIEQLFPDRDPEKEAYFRFRADFVSDDDLILLVYDSGDPLSAENMALLREFTGQLEELASLESVYSLSNIERLSLAGEVVQIDEYFPAGLPDAEVELRKVELQGHPLYGRALISADGTLGGMLLDLADEFNTHKDRQILLAQLDSLRNGIPWTWYDAGLPVLRTRYVEAMQSEQRLFLPVAMVLSLLVLYAMFRQRRALIYPLVAIGITLIWVAGIMALLDYTINIVSYLTFNLLLIVGISDSIHIMVKYYELLGQGLRLRETLEKIFQRIGGALFLTSFTTAVGFLSLVTTNVLIVKQFGISLAIGVVLMFVVTLLVIPSMLALTPVPNQAELERHAAGIRLRAARRLSHWVEHRPYVILGTFAALLLLSLVGIGRISTQAGVLDDIRSGEKVYTDYRFVGDRMMEILPLEVIYDSGQAGGLGEVDNLRHMAALQQFLTDQPAVTAATSLTDHLALANTFFGSGQAGLPTHSAAVRDLLEVLDPELLAAFADPPLRKGRISARVGNIHSEQADELQAAIAGWAGNHLPAGQSVQITGTTFLALRTNDHIVRSMTSSFMLAFLIILSAMTLLFRSLRLALLSVLPNVLPILAVAGFMGLVGIKLRPTTVMIFAVAFGIAVDDTIHFLVRFRQELTRLGGQYRAAVAETLVTTGKALISTTAVLLLGFSVLLFSKFLPQFQFGLLAGLVLLIALLASVTLLPVLLLAFRPRVPGVAGKITASEN